MAYAILSTIMSFTDIRHWDWIYRLPKDVQPYVFLARLDRPTGWWLLLLPGWIAIALAGEKIDTTLVGLLLLFFVGAIVLRAAGCVINDLWDQELDQKVERTASRPIASGQINVEDAVIFLGILLLAGLALLLLLPPISIFLGILVIPPIVIYPLMKRFTWWPQVFLGLTFNFSVLIGWSAVTGSLSLPGILLYLAGLIWTVGYDTIYAHQDRDDDQRSGIKSLALKLGGKSKQGVALFYVGAFILFVLTLIMAGAEWWTFLYCMPAVIYTIHRLLRWDPEDKASSLWVFQTSRNTGLLLFGALMLANLL